MASLFLDEAFCRDSGELVAFSAGKWRHEDESICDHEIQGRHPQASPEARRIGLLSMIQPGCSLRSVSRSDAKGGSLGGIVVADDETVEDGQTVRVFTCLDDRVGNGRSFQVRRLKETELDELSVDLPNSSWLKAMVARLDETCAKAMHKRGPVLPEIVDFQKWAWELSVLIVYGGRS